MRGAEKWTPGTYTQYWQMGKVQDWRWLADVERQHQVPQCIVETAMRPAMVLYSECICIVDFIELMTPFEDAIQEAFERT